MTRVRILRKVKNFTARVRIRQWLLILLLVSLPILFVSGCEECKDGEHNYKTGDVFVPDDCGGHWETHTWCTKCGKEQPQPGQ